jgi:hypothetical protein
VIDGANRHDVVTLEPTLDAIGKAGLLDDIGTLHLDRVTTPARYAIDSATAASTSSRSSGAVPRCPA